MSQEQFYAEVMAELELTEYNTNLGIGESSVTTYLHSGRNSSTDGQIREMGSSVMYQGQIKSH